MTLVCHQQYFGETKVYGVMTVICFKYYFQKHEFKGICNIKMSHLNRSLLANVYLKQNGYCAHYYFAYMCDKYEN